MKRIVYLVMLLSAVLNALVLAQDNRILSKGYALFSKDGEIYSFEFTRHPLGDNDVLIDILYADIHQGKVGR